MLKLLMVSVPWPHQMWHTQLPSKFLIVPRENVELGNSGGTRETCSLKRAIDTYMGTFAGRLDEGCPAKSTREVLHGKLGEKPGRRLIHGNDWRLFRGSLRRVTKMNCPTKA
ncbi:hypothetical protein LWI29_033071 [Acer saccharum]|uniref:Uncharacterized protein n=1 Tax=Acer saccharum TaxID=4024 RepID=A0AA39V3Z0_ACESA|nr:hypothetical protein LWI29_033071 [Acer saccharum]